MILLDELDTPHDATRVLVAHWNRSLERRNVTVRSQERMTATVRRLAAHMFPRPLLDATRDDLETWLDDCKVGPTSRRCYLTFVRVFYRWTVDEGLIVVNPADRVPVPRMRRYLPRPLGEADLAHAVAQAPDARMRCWLVLAGWAGLRCQEIAGLQRSDILDERDPPLIHVVAAKGGRQRLVPAHPEVLAALRQLPMPPVGYLFPHTVRGGMPIEPWSVSHKVGGFLRDCGIPASCHQLRHRFATAVYAVSHDIRVTQELLGHASPATTAVYAAFSPTDAAAAVAGLR